MSNDTLTLAQQLVACASLTPNDNGCQQILIERLKKLGFQIENMRFGEVDNLGHAVAIALQLYALPATPMSCRQVRWINGIAIHLCRPFGMAACMDAALRI